MTRDEITDRLKQACALVDEVRESLATPSADWLTMYRLREVDFHLEKVQEELL